MGSKANYRHLFRGVSAGANVTGVLHVFIGTYELLNFRSLSGQASRCGLDIHFPHSFITMHWCRLSPCVSAY